MLMIVIDSHDHNETGWTLSSVQNPGKYLNTCNESSLYFFRFFPVAIQQSVCSLYQGLQDFQAQSHAGGYALVSQLVRVGPFLVTLLSYESFRQQTFWRRRGASLYLLLAQALSGAVSIPLYFATLCWDIQSPHTSSKAKQTTGSATTTTLSKPKVSKFISSAEGWSVFASATVGYLLPLLYGTYSHWSNRAITVFLGFPIYVMTINTILPTLLLRASSGLAYQSPKIPLLLSALACLVTSFHGHLRLLANIGTMSLHDIFWPSGPNGLTRDLHILLLHDYAFVLIELVSFILLYTYRLKSRKEKQKAITLLLLISAIAGPTAALAIIWTMAELSDVNENQESDIDETGPRTPSASRSFERQPVLARQDSD